ncbi:MAG: hypothetical protein ACK518_02220, partial [bacterium]
AKYGNVCPHCQKRWGQVKPAGFIDIERCPSCPSFDLTIIWAVRKLSTKKARERERVQLQGTVAPRVSSSDLLRRL